MKKLSILLIVTIIIFCIISACKNTEKPEQSEQIESLENISDEMSSDGEISFNTDAISYVIPVNEDKNLNYFDIEITKASNAIMEYLFIGEQSWMGYRENNAEFKDVYKVKCLSVDYFFKMFTNDDPQNKYTTHIAISTTQIQIISVIDKIYDYGYQEGDIITLSNSYGIYFDNYEKQKGFFVGYGGKWIINDQGYEDLILPDGNYPLYLNNEYIYTLFKYGQDLPMEPEKEYIILYNEKEDSNGINQSYAFLNVPLENRDYKKIKGYEKISLHPYVVAVMQDLYDLYADK